MVRTGGIGDAVVVVARATAPPPPPARRLAEMLWDDPRLKGKVTAALFIGDSGKHGAVCERHDLIRRELQSLFAMR